MPDPTFQGGVMLAGWSESHNGGAKVSFWLEGPEDLDAFRSLTTAKGKTAGQRFAMVLVEIDDDETPKKPEQKQDPKGGPLARVAGQLCSSITFQHWLYTCPWFTPDGIQIAPPEMGPEGAAEIIRKVCGVGSRAELDHLEAAAEIFHRRIRKPWLMFSGQA